MGRGGRGVPGWTLVVALVAALAAPASAPAATKSACARLRSEEQGESKAAEHRETARHQRLERRLARQCRMRREAPAKGDIHVIKHVVVVMQENRSFDEYFGTFPGADGIPRDKQGNFTVCVPDPRAGGCQKPFHDPEDTNAGGPHYHESADADIDGGKMDGFIKSVEQSQDLDTDKASCSVAGKAPSCVDVMGFHDAHEIPNYWAYARNYVLQDHMFEPADTWSLPAHLLMVSAWSASCSTPGVAASCKSDLGFPDHDGITSDNPFVQQGNGAALGILASTDDDDTQASSNQDYAWTDITWMLHKYGVSWRYYLEQGTEPDCPTGAMSCAPRPQAVRTPEIWNPLPDFTTVQQNNQLGNIVPLAQFFQDANAGKLPAVSWVIPSGDDSEHPFGTVSAGQRHVTQVVNALMKGPDWNSTAIFLAWDDWGGFYDHMAPPVIGGQQYGLRVPGLVISPYARQGYIDHQTLSFDAYLKFIEDDFLGGRRLDPATDGRPDPRPGVRETAPGLGDLRRDFDFAQQPRAPKAAPVPGANFPGPTTLPEPYLPIPPPPQ